MLAQDTTKENIFKDEYGNIRYRGKNPNNYVTFNNETWRIIGYVDGYVKLISNYYVTTSYGWEDEVDHNWADWNYSNNDWTNSILMKYLNSTEVNNADKDGSYWTILADEAKNMIEKTTWHLGGFSSLDILAKEAYKKERGTDTYGTNPATWEGYVGLVYPSDYIYATSDECSKNIHLSNFGDYNNSACNGTGWIDDYARLWTITHVNYLSDQVVVIENGNGIFNPISCISDSPISCEDYGIYAKPVINLKSNVRIISGTGSIDDPFKLEI